MQMNVADWVIRNAERHRGKRAIVAEERTTSYAALAERVSRLAAALRARGVSPGDRVAALMYNQPELVEALFACAWLEAVLVPLNWRLSVEELTFIVDDCEPVALLYDGTDLERATALAEATASIEHRAGTGEGGDYEPWLEDVTPLDEPPRVDADSSLEIMYTAGSTGRPKGVVLTQGNLFWQTINGWALGADSNAVALALLPMFHAGGLNGSVLPPLHIGATVVLHRAFDAKKVLRSVSDQGVTGILGVPTVFQMISDLPEFDEIDLTGCRFLSGGAPLPEALIDRFHGRGLELAQGYGLTETAPGATGMWPGDCFRKPGSVGRPCLYVDVRVVDGEDEPLPAGEVGEVVIRGPNVMKGYWRQPEATREALRGGWFHSGDLGRFDDDGFLYIVGRKKEMIISGGENVFPAEIEKLLSSHPDVELAAVVGAADSRWGEVPVAFVQPRSMDEADGEALRAFCAERLARYKVPRDVRFLDALPLSGPGKIDKVKLAGLLSEE